MPTLDYLSIPQKLASELLELNKNGKSEYNWEVIWYVSNDSA